MSSSLFVVISEAGLQRDISIDSRHQPYWDEHAAFIDALVADGFIVLGGPFPDEGGAMLVVCAEDEASVRVRLGSDPWYVHELLRLVAIHRWEIFIDEEGASLAEPLSVQIAKGTVLYQTRLQDHIQLLQAN